jgi:hypothetical protein
MSAVDELYRRYVQEYRDDGDADPRPYLAELTGVERAELSLRIDRFLQNAPAPEFNAEVFARFRADPARKAMVERVLNPETLATMRAASGLTKADAAVALAEELELTGHERAVKARYHDIEAGNTDPARIRRRVWEALAAVLKAPSEKLREAAESAFGGGPPFAPAFARAPLRGSRPGTYQLMTPIEEPNPADAIVDRVFFED